MSAQRLVIAEARIVVRSQMLIDTDALAQTWDPFTVMRIHINDMTSQLEDKDVPIKSVQWWTEPREVFGV